MFFFPKGSKITFRTERGGLGFYCGQRKSEWSLLIFVKRIIADVEAEDTA